LKSEKPDIINELDFEYLVKRYQKELMRILQDVPVSKTLNKSERARLLQSGILVREGRGSNVRWIVSKEARNILKKLYVQKLEETCLLESKELDFKKNNEAKSYLLSSGIPCTIHKCVKCCIDTLMPLTQFDVGRISRQGYKHKDFVVKRRKERVLKNIDGRCVFLGDDGCIIYVFRPEGCRLYPLVYNEKYEKVVLHHLCPYGHEFKVSRDDIDDLLALYRKLYQNE
jgi:Fe-S-cluster containining protein